MYPARKNWLNAFLLLLISCLVVACGNGDPAKDAPQPEEATLAFFDALYNEKNLDKAVKYVTPKTSRIMLHYKTAKQVQKHVINLKLDQVNMEVDNSARGKALLDASAKKANVTIFFDGLYDGNPVRDMKTIEMVKQKGQWKVKKIKADPYS